MRITIDNCSDEEAQRLIGSLNLLPIPQSPMRPTDAERVARIKSKLACVSPRLWPTCLDDMAWLLGKYEGKV